MAKITNSNHTHTNGATVILFTSDIRFALNLEAISVEGKWMIVRLAYGDLSLRRFDTEILGFTVFCYNFERMLVE